MVGKQGAAAAAAAAGAGAGAHRRLRQHLAQLASAQDAHDGSAGQAAPDARGVVLMLAGGQHYCGHGARCHAGGC